MCVLSSLATVSFQNADISWSTTDIGVDDLQYPLCEYYNNNIYILQDGYCSNDFYILQDGYCYYSNKIRSFNTTSQTYSLLQSTVSTTLGFLYDNPTSKVLINNYLYFLPYDCADCTPDSKYQFYKLDLKTLSIELLSPKQNSEEALSALCYDKYNSIIYSIGGCCPQNNVVKMYNINNDTWSFSPYSLNIPRAGAYCIEYNGTIYAMLGQGFWPYDDRVETLTFDLFNAESGLHGWTWTDTHIPFYSTSPYVVKLYPYPWLAIMGGKEYNTQNTYTTNKMFLYDLENQDVIMINDNKLLPFLPDHGCMTYDYIMRKIYWIGGQDSSNYTYEFINEIWETPLLINNNTLPPANWSRPTTAPTIFDHDMNETIFDMNSNKTVTETTLDDIDFAEQLATTFQSIIISVIAIFVIVAIIGLIDARLIRINDFYRVSSIIVTLFELLDMFSDCFFAIDVSLAAKTKKHVVFTIILYLYIIFIVIPTLFSLLQVYYYASKIWIHDNRARMWLLKYSKALYLLSIFTSSSFTAIDFMNSNMLNLPYFAMGLTNKQIISFKTQKIYSIVLLENIPQLGLQIWYMIELGKFNIIAISSTIFSAISIIATVLSMTTQKTLIDSQEYTLIKMDITGKSVIAKINKCINNVTKIRQGISTLIGINYRLIEILKPQHISNGLELEIILYVDNAENTKKKFDDKFNDSKHNGSLAQLVFDAWHLPGVPDISNLQYIVVQSKNQRTESMVMMGYVSM